MNALRCRPCAMWMLCLVLVLPAVGRAATDIPEEAPDQFLVDERARQAEAWWKRTDERRGPRILGEVGAGLLTGGVLGLASGYGAGALCLMSGRYQGPYAELNCLYPAFIGAAVGVVLGLPLGVWWAGDALKGNGSLLATLGGEMLGVAGALALAGVVSVVFPQGDDLEVVLGVGVPVLALAGGVLGYELSQKAPRWRAGLASVQPRVSITPRATVFGLSGSF